MALAKKPSVCWIWNRETTCFLVFTRLEHAQATCKHTEPPTTQFGSVPFVDTIITGHYVRKFSDIDPVQARKYHAIFENLHHGPLFL